MSIADKFGSRVKELRKRAGLTQAQLAAKCGRYIEMQRIGEIERGERNCTLETVEKLAKGLKVEPAELFLFRPQQVGKSMSLLGARITDLWKAASERQKQKVVTVVTEMLTP